VDNFSHCAKQHCNGHGPYFGVQGKMVNFFVLVLNKKMQFSAQFWFKTTMLLHY